MTAPIPSVLSPFQSPTTGSAFLLPNLNVPASALPTVAVCRSVQVKLPESKVPIPSLPSPFQSPATGRAFLAPNLKIPAFAGPADAPSRSDHSAFFGSYTPMSSRPSPFQSPTTGSVPDLPKTNTPASGVPADAPLLWTPTVRFAMLRRNWLRPMLPTYAIVVSKFAPSSRCTDVVYW